MGTATGDLFDITGVGLNSSISPNDGAEELDFAQFWKYVWARMSSDSDGAQAKAPIAADRPMIDDLQNWDEDSMSGAQPLMTGNFALDQFDISESKSPSNAVSVRAASATRGEVVEDIDDDDD